MEDLKDKLPVQGPTMGEQCPRWYPSGLPTLCTVWGGGQGDRAGGQESQAKAQMANQ